jgi:hypothetical protein
MSDSETHGFSGPGFLTAEASNHCLVIQQRNKRLFNFLQETICNLRSNAKQLGLPEQTTDLHQRQVVSLILVARILEISEAAVLIMRHGMSNEASTLLRVFIDAYFILVRIGRDENFVEEFFRSDEKQRLTLMNVARTSKSDNFDALKDYASDDIVAELKGKIESLEIASLQSSTNAEKAGCMNLYDSIFRLCSPAVHSTPRALEKYVEEDDGVVTKIWTGPSAEEIPQKLYDFSYFLIRVQTGVTELFEEKNTASVEDRMDALNRASEGLIAQAEFDDAPYL